MTACPAPENLVLTPVPDGHGGFVHEWRPAPPETPAKRKKRRVPDPIQATAENAAQMLRMFIERLERLHEEKRGIADDITDVLAEAKATGFDTKTMNKILALRQLENHVRQEDEALLETYKASLGIE